MSFSSYFFNTKLEIFKKFFVGSLKQIIVLNIVIRNIIEGQIF
jgi:hypothetical protein